MSVVRVKKITNNSGSGNISIPTSNTLSSTSGQPISSRGKLIQVQHVRTSATLYSIASQDIFPIPELSIDFYPKVATSSILVSAMINSSATYVSTFGFLRNDQYIIYNINSNSAGSISTVYDGYSATDYMYGSYIEYMDFARGTTEKINYKAAACSSWAGTVNTLYINDRAAGDMKSFSSMTIKEFA